MPAGLRWLRPYGEPQVTTSFKQHLMLFETLNTVALSAPMLEQVMAQEFTRAAGLLLALGVHDGGNTVVVQFVEVPQAPRGSDIRHGFDIENKDIHGGLQTT